MLMARRTAARRMTVMGRHNHGARLDGCFIKTQFIHSMDSFDSFDSFDDSFIHSFDYSRFIRPTRLARARLSRARRIFFVEFARPLNGALTAPTAHSTPTSSQLRRRRPPLALGMCS
jgi:hypothetical protein